MANVESYLRFNVDTGNLEYAVGGNWFTIADSPAAGSVVPASITTTTTDDFTFPRDVIATRNLECTGTIFQNGEKDYSWTIDASTGRLALNDVTDSSTLFTWVSDASYVNFTQQVDCSNGLHASSISSISGGLPIALVNSNANSLIIYNTVTNAYAMNVNTNAGVVSLGGAASGKVSASVEVISNTGTQGFLPPLCTTSQKNAISSPDEGLTVYDTTLHALCFYNGSAWKTVTAS